MRHKDAVKLRLDLKWEHGERPCSEEMAFSGGILEPRGILELL